MPVLEHGLHGGERDGRLARAHRGEDHRPVALVQEVSRLLLVWPKFHVVLRLINHAQIAPPVTFAKNCNATI